jgi:hypothetical protein
VRIITYAPLAAVAVVTALTGSAQAMPVHVQRTPVVRQNVHIRLTAPRLPEGGYYYGVIVLKPYRRYTRASPPPCSASSNMQATDYGYPQPNGVVTLALTPAKSKTGHWCREGFYEGAVYAVPHAPPCESSYPCHSEPYGPHQECAGVGPECVHGIVARPTQWSYPDPLPSPLASGTRIVGRFSVKFTAPSRARRSETGPSQAASA